METKDVLYELRTKKGLSQDELAEKVFVTRQAVSRWENGDTVPNTFSANSSCDNPFLVLNSYKISLVSIFFTSSIIIYL